MSDIPVGIGVDADTSDAVKGFRNLEQVVTDLNKSIKKLATAQISISNNLKGIKDETATTNKLMRERENLRTTSAKLATSEKLLYQLYVNNSGVINRNYLSSIGGLRRAYARLNSEFSQTLVKHQGQRKLLSDSSLGFYRASIKADMLSRTLHNMSTQLVNVGKNAQWTGRQLMVGVTLPIAGIGLAAIQSAREVRELEVQLTKLTNGMGVTRLGNQAKQLAQDFGTARTELMQVQNTFAQIGFGTIDIENLTKATVQFSKLGDVDLKTAGEMVRVLRQAGVEGQALTNTLAKLNLIEDQTSLSMKEVAVGLPRVFPVFKQYGDSAEEVAAAISAIHQAGLPATEAANSLKAAITKLAPALASIEKSTDGGTRLKALRESLRNLSAMTGTKLSFEDPNTGQMRKGIDMLMMLAKAYGTVKDSGNLEKQKELVEFIRAAFGAHQSAKMSQFLDSAAKSMKEGTHTAEQFTRAWKIAQDESNNAFSVWERQLSQVLDADVTKLAGQLERLKIEAQELGRLLIPMAVSVLTKVTDLIQKFSAMSDESKRTIVKLAAAIALLGPATYIYGQGLLSVAQSFKIFLSGPMKLLLQYRHRWADLGDATKGVNKELGTLLNKFDHGQISADEFTTSLTRLTSAYAALGTTAASANRNAASLSALEKLGIKSRSLRPDVVQRAAVDASIAKAITDRLDQHYGQLAPAKRKSQSEIERTAQAIAEGQYRGSQKVMGRSALPAPTKPDDWFQSIFRRFTISTRNIPNPLRLLYGGPGAGLDGLGAARSPHIQPNGFARTSPLMQTLAFSDTEDSVLQKAARLKTLDVLAPDRDDIERLKYQLNNLHLLRQSMIEFYQIFDVDFLPTSAMADFLRETDKITGLAGTSLMTRFRAIGAHKAELDLTGTSSGKLNLGTWVDELFRLKAGGDVDSKSMAGFLGHDDSTTTNALIGLVRAASEAPGKRKKKGTEGIPIPITDGLVNALNSVLKQTYGVDSGLLNKYDEIINAEKAIWVEWRKKRDEKLKELAKVSPQIFDYDRKYVEMHLDYLFGREEDLVFPKFHDDGTPMLNKDGTPQTRRGLSAVTKQYLGHKEKVSTAEQPRNLYDVEDGKFSVLKRFRGKGRSPRSQASTVRATANARIRKEIVRDSLGLEKIVDESDSALTKRIQIRSTEIAKDYRKAIGAKLSRKKLFTQKGMNVDEMAKILQLATAEGISLSTIQSMDMSADFWEAVGLRVWGGASRGQLARLVADRIGDADTTKKFSLGIANAAEAVARSLGASEETVSTFVNDRLALTSEVSEEVKANNARMKRLREQGVREFKRRKAKRKDEMDGIKKKIANEIKATYEKGPAGEFIPMAGSISTKKDEVVGYPTYLSEVAYHTAGDVHPDHREKLRRRAAKARGKRGTQAEAPPRMTITPEGIQVAGTRDSRVGMKKLIERSIREYEARVAAEIAEELTREGFLFTPFGRTNDELARIGSPGGGGGFDAAEIPGGIDRADYTSFRHTVSVPKAKATGMLRGLGTFRPMETKNQRLEAAEMAKMALRAASRPNLGGLEIAKTLKATLPGHGVLDIIEEAIVNQLRLDEIIPSVDTLFGDDVPEDTRNEIAMLVSKFAQRMQGKLAALDAVFGSELRQAVGEQAAKISIATNYAQPTLAGGIYGAQSRMYNADELRLFSRMKGAGRSGGTSALPGTRKTAAVGLMDTLVELKDLVGQTDVYGEGIQELLDDASGDDLSEFANLLALRLQEEAKVAQDALEEAGEALEQIQLDFLGEPEARYQRAQKARLRTRKRIETDPEYEFGDPFGRQKALNAIDEEIYEAEQAHLRMIRDKTGQLKIGQKYERLIQTDSYKAAAELHEMRKKAAEEAIEKANKAAALAANPLGITYGMKPTGTTAGPGSDFIKEIADKEVIRTKALQNIPEIDAQIHEIELTLGALTSTLTEAEQSVYDDFLRQLQEAKAEAQKVADDAYREQAILRELAPLKQRAAAEAKAIADAEYEMEKARIEERNRRNRIERQRLENEVNRDRMNRSRVRRIRRVVFGRDDMGDLTPDEAVTRLEMIRQGKKTSVRNVRREMAGAAALEAARMTAAYNAQVPMANAVGALLGGSELPMEKISLGETGRDRRGRRKANPILDDLLQQHGARGVMDMLDTDQKRMYGQQILDSMGIGDLTRKEKRAAGRIGSKGRRAAVGARAEQQLLFVDTAEELLDMKPMRKRLIPKAKKNAMVLGSVAETMLHPASWGRGLKKLGPKALKQAAGKSKLMAVLPGGAAGGMASVMTSMVAFTPIILAAAAAIVLIWKNWDKVSKGIGGGLKALKQGFGALIQSIAGPFKALWKRLTGDSKNGQKAMSNMWKNVGKTLNVVFHILGGAMKLIGAIAKPIFTAIAAAIEIVVRVVQFIIALFTGDWKGALEAAKGIWKAAFDGMRGIVAMLLKFVVDGLLLLPNLFLTVLESIVRFASKIPIIGDKFKGVANMIKGFREQMNGIGSDIKSGIDSLIGGKDNEYNVKVTYDPDFKKMAKKRKEAAKKLGLDRGLSEEKAVLYSNYVEHEYKVRQKKLRDEAAKKKNPRGGGPKPISEADAKIIDEEAWRHAMQSGSAYMERLLKITEQDTGALEAPDTEAFTGAIEEATEEADALIAAFRDELGQMTDSWKDAIMGAFEDWADEQREALDKMHEAQIDGIDAQIKAIDDLTKAEEELEYQRQYAENKEELRRKRRHSLVSYQRERDKAIYEGRYDDAALLDLNRESEVAQENKEAADLEKDYAKHTLEQQRELEKEKLEQQKEHLAEVFEQQKEAQDREIELKRQGLQAQIDEYAKFAPKSAAAARDMQNKMLAALGESTDGHARIGDLQAKSWAASWSAAIENSKKKVADDAYWSGRGALEAFASGLGIDLAALEPASPPSATEGPAYNDRAKTPTSWGGRFHTGGEVGSMAGGPQDVPATLQTGEYVIQRSAARRLGKATLDQLNNAHRAVFHDGGLVDRTASVGGAFKSKIVQMAEMFKSGKLEIGGMNFDEYKAKVNSGEIGSIFSGLMGEVPAAFAKMIAGLVPGAQQLAKMVFGAVPGAIVTSTTSGSHTQGSNHYVGRAIDFDMIPNEMNARIWSLLLPYAKSGILSELFFDPMGGYKNGKSIGPIGGHANHLHAAIASAYSNGFGAVLGNTASGPKQIVKSMMAQFGWGEDQWSPLERLVQNESGWNPGAANPTSSARGLFQFLKSTWQSYITKQGGPAYWSTDPKWQAQGGLSYIKSRYGTPQKALEFWMAQNPHWYHKGGMVFDIPKLDTGGFIKSSGIAEVHKGERVLNASETAALGTKVEVNLHFDGGYFGSDRELQKLVDTIEKQIVPKINRVKGLENRTGSRI